MYLFLPDNVIYIINILNKNGFEAWCVGGCVRDSLLRHEPDDWDITTNASPMQVKSLFRKTIDTGLKHGTITLIIENDSYEITTYRLESEYESNRRPKEVFFVGSLKEDLSRRDFTINAMAYNPTDGLRDYYEGKTDLKKRLIRCVGEANKRFSEDALRMLRAVRFQAQLNFTLEESTFDAVRSNAYLLNNISKERILAEVNKILLSPRPEAVLDLYDANLLEYILPRFNSVINNKKIFIRAKLSQIPNVPALRWAALFIMLDANDIVSIRDSLRELTMDNKTLDRVMDSICNYSIPSITSLYELRKLIFSIGRKCFEDVIVLKSSIEGYNENTHYLMSLYNKVIETNSIFTLRDLDISGSDIISLGYNEGIEIGNILNDLMDAVLKNPGLNKREKLIALVNKMKVE